MRVERFLGWIITFALLAGGSVSASPYQADEFDPGRYPPRPESALPEIEPSVTRSESDASTRETEGEDVVEGDHEESGEPIPSEQGGEEFGMSEGVEGLFTLRGTIPKGAPLFDIKSGRMLPGAQDYQLTFGILSQIDARFFTPNDRDPQRSGLYLPRTWFLFEGKLGEPYEFQAAIARGIEGDFDILDAALDIAWDERLKLKFGRFLTPYSFEWYDHLPPFFIAPERSLFALNFGLERQVGVMAHGFLNEGQFEYAVGGFDSRLITAADLGGGYLGVGYINSRPFLNAGIPSLRNLNVGASIAGGTRVRREVAPPLRTAVSTGELTIEDDLGEGAADAASPTFLIFNEGVNRFGDELLGAIHLSWYLGSGSIETEFYGASFGHALGAVDPEQIPIFGFHTTGSYFLTGEQVERRTFVDPIRPFWTGRGVGGPGAIEAYARFAYLELGEEVFDEGFADPDLWSRASATTDIGINWYLTRNVRFIFGWQHNLFGSAILKNDEGDFSRTTDFFWIRGQFYF